MWLVLELKKMNIYMYQSYTGCTLKPWTCHEETRTNNVLNTEYFVTEHLIYYRYLEL